MARIALTAVLIVLLNVLVGCASIDSGKSQLMPRRGKLPLGSAPVPEDASEIDITDQVSENRRAYRQGLELLVRYYTSTGNHMKLTWAERELRALNSMPQYNYIVEASVGGPDLKARDSIAEADFLFRDALDLEKRAGPLHLGLIRNKGLLRRALDKYNRLIRQYPSSDKIDDAAYKAAGIYEYFKDYSIALLYYQRTYQWDPETTYAARFKEAFVLDRRLRRRAEALEAYRRAVKSIRREGEHREWKERAEERIRVLTKREKGSK